MISIHMDAHESFVYFFVNQFCGPIFFPVLIYAIGKFDDRFGFDNIELE
jgi:hypothetical protein